VLKYLVFFHPLVPKKVEEGTRRGAGRRSSATWQVAVAASEDVVVKGMEAPPG